MKVGSGIWQRTQRYEFEVTASGWILFAFELVNAADDGDPGGNPTGLLWSLRATNGTVVARSDDDTEILEYPSSDPQVPIGRQIRQVMIGNDLLDGWTVTGTGRPTILVRRSRRRVRWCIGWVGLAVGCRVAVVRAVHRRGGRRRRSDVASVREGDGRVASTLELVAGY